MVVNPGQLTAQHSYAGIMQISTYIGVVTSVGWQITLCDPIDKWRPVVLR